MPIRISTTTILTTAPALVENNVAMFPLGTMQSTESSPKTSPVAPNNAAVAEVADEVAIAAEAEADEAQAAAAIEAVAVEVDVLQDVATTASFGFRV